MLIRCRYSKYGEMAFVSHLDLLRIFIRSLRRASIEVEYSKGFHPHPKISFSPALSLGVESVCEFVDIETQDEYELDIFKDKINYALPKGVEILKVESSDKICKISNISNYSEYELSLEKIETDVAFVLEKILKSEEIFIQKKNKKGKLMEIDVRSKIYDAKFLDNKIRVILLNSNDGAMKPAEFINILNLFSDEAFVINNILKVNIYNFDGREMVLVN